MAKTAPAEEGWKIASDNPYGTIRPILLADFSQQKSNFPQMAWEEVTMKDFIDIRTSREGTKRWLWTDWEGGGACIAVLVSASLLLREVFSSSSGSSTSK